MASAAATIEQCRSLVEDITFPRARAWHDDGGRVVGSFPVYAPMELVHAAGMLPVNLFGAGGGVEIERADARIQSFVCSITRSTLELGLRGNLDAFDGLLFTNICDVARNLSGVFARNFPSKMIEYLHLPQNPASTAALDYMMGELCRLIAALEKLGGGAITRADLIRSVAAFEANRDALRALYHLRESHPWVVSAVDSYLLTRAAGLMPKEEHTAMLRAVIDELSARDGRPMDKVRVLLVGSFCEQPPLALLQAVEDAGCYVLDDDLAQGLRFVEPTAPPNGDPLRAIAAGFLHGTVNSSAYHGTRSRTEWILERAKALKVDGILFCTAKFCEPALYDYIPYKEALEKAGIPHLHIEFEEKMTAFEQVRTQVETFVESVLFD